MSKIKRLTAAAAALTLTATFSACSSERTSGETETSGGGETQASEDVTIGISMPTRSLERWTRDGQSLVANLEEMGYATDLQYADNKVQLQIDQIQNMVNQGVDVLVVGSIDGSALGPVLESAHANDITVIAYDRLINGTEAVDYYATFDNYRVGQMQGEYIRDALDLENTTETFNFEPFAGSPDDNNARFFFEGAWDVLQPYIEDGTLEVPSGKDPANVDGWQSIGIQAWMAPAAQSEMETRLNSFYSDRKVDAVLAPNDALALGISQALDAAGYTTGDEWPVITGQDADQANVQNILNGKQAMTVWKDTRALGDQVAIMIDQIVKGEEVEVNDTETYDNGVKVVPSYLLDPIVITEDNVESELVDSGFYSKEDLGL